MSSELETPKNSFYENIKKYYKQLEIVPIDKLILLWLKYIELESLSVVNSD